MVKKLRKLALQEPRNPSGRRASDPTQIPQRPATADPFPTFQEAVDLNTQALFALQRTFDLSRLDLGLLNKSLGAIKATFDQANSLQATFLSTNRRLNDVIGNNTDQLAAMPGDFGAAVQAQFEFLESGLIGAGKDSLTLATTMKAVGLATTELIKTNLDAATFGRATPESLDRLNSVILDTTTKQGVSFNRLIGAVNNLSKNMRVLGFLGITTDILKTQTKLIGDFGAGSEKMISSLMGKLFDPQASIAEQSILGIFDKLKAFRGAGGGTPEAFRDIVETAARRFEEISEPFKAAGIPLEMMADALGAFGGIGGFGDMSNSLLKFEESLSARDRMMGEATQKFDETFQTFVSEVWQPLKVTLMRTFTPIIKFLTSIAPALGKIITIAVPLLIAMKLGRIAHILNQKRLDNNTRGMFILGGKINMLAVKMGMAQSGQAMPMRSGLLAIMGGPVGLILGAVSIAASFAMLSKTTMDSESHLASIDRKTPEPDVASSLFADRTSSILKSTVLSTILGGNALLEALNTSNAETATRIGSLVDILLADRTSIRASIGGRRV